MTWSFARRTGSRCITVRHRSNGLDFEPVFEIMIGIVENNEGAAPNR